MSKILVPVPRKSKAKIFPLSPRPSTLKGKTIALYHNDKVASFPAMETIGELLKKKIGAKETFEVHSKASFSRHPDWAIEEALRADAVVAGTGDWGSCTAWVLDAAVRIEKGGKPAVFIISPAFREEAISHSRMHGMPYLQFVVVNYTKEVRSLIQPAVEQVFDKFVRALTTPASELEKKIPGEVI